MAVPVNATELSAQQMADVTTMLALAKKSHLAQRPEWLKINLYHPLWGGQVSRVDDPTYFISPQGKSDPQAELEATIRGAFEVEMAQQSRQPSVCRWIARYQFLSRSMKELGFDYQEPTCEGFEKWKSGISTHRATLIFASVYLNSPASMYGHSFIRFDSAKSGEYNRLNDTTIGYSVGGGQNDGMLFIVRSLVGGYPGVFVSVPFYMKVREYSDLENRDLWEYRTNLSGAEIDRMLAFIWEQSFTYLDYYFFDDNCAFMLLATFEAGRPELDLIEQGKPWFIPLDVAKLMRAQTGLVESVHYRPSQFNTLQANFYRAPEPVRQQALAWANGDLETAAEDSSSQAEVLGLDLALGILEYQRNQKTSEKDALPFSQRQMKLAGLRSKSDVTSSYEKAVRPRNSPDEGHDSARMAMAVGRVGESNYTQINLRGGYHDELDPESGFSIGSRSNMFNLYLRANATQLQFERLDLFDVFSPSVSTEWFSQPTIKFNIGLRRELLNSDKLTPTAFRLEAGAGESYRWGDHARTFILADSATNLAGGISSLAGGPTAGVIWSATPSMRAELTGNAHWYAFGQLQNAWLCRAEAALAWDLGGSQNNLRVNVVRQTLVNSIDLEHTYTQVQMAYAHYF